MPSYGKQNYNYAPKNIGSQVKNNSKVTLADLIIVLPTIIHQIISNT